MRNLLICMLLPMFILVGCSGSTYILTGEKRAPTTPDKVKVYSASDRPAKYKAIAEITSKKMSAFLTDQIASDSAIEMLKEQAALLGANGLILGSRTYVEEGYDSRVYMTGVAIHVDAK